MAFQPIVDLQRQQIFAYEALVRGVNGESAGQILAKVNETNRFRFDQECRRKAVQLASQLNLDSWLCINILPSAIYQPQLCLQQTFDVTEKFGFSPNRIIFEITETEKVYDRQHLLDIIREYRQYGFQTAIDDFGAGFSGLNLLAEFQPNLIKLDMALIRNIDRDTVRQTIVEGILGVAKTLNSQVVAEGVETRDELLTLQNMGLRFIQGYYFSKPVLETLPQIDPDLFIQPPDHVRHYDI